MRTRLALALALAALTVAPGALADEPLRPERFDPGDYPPPHARWNMLLAGASATGSRRRSEWCSSLDGAPAAV